MRGTSSFLGYLTLWKIQFLPLNGNRWASYIQFETAYQHYFKYAYSKLAMKYFVWYVYIDDIWVISVASSINTSVNRGYSTGHTA